MIKPGIAEAIRAYEAQRKVCNLYFRYQRGYFINLIPLASSDTLFLCAQETDFLLDGFTVRRLKDVLRVKAVSNKCDDILRCEGILDGLTVPDIDLSGWQMVFESLRRLHNNVIVEKETPDGHDEIYVVGRIVELQPRHLLLRHFDADGVWQREPFRIAYSALTSVTFGSRYMEIFSRYIGEPPEK